MYKRQAIVRCLVGLLVVAAGIYMTVKWTSDELAQGVLLIGILLIGGLIIGIKAEDELPRGWWLVRFVPIGVLILLRSLPGFSECASAMIFLVLGIVLLVVEDKMRMSG